jgi:hypothetical protein
MDVTYTLILTFTAAASAPKGTAPIPPQFEPGLTIQQCLEREREVKKQYRTLPYTIRGQCKPARG